MTLIKLTLANDEINEDGKKGETIIVNAAYILHASKNHCIENTTLLELINKIMLVRETPDEIYEAVWQEEHQECRL